MHRPLVLGALVFAVTACESGLSRLAKVTVDQGGFSPSSPGAVVADLGGSAAVYVVLCGQALPNPLQLSQDLGFGCLTAAEKGTSETVRAWVAPLPPDAGLACSTPRPFFEALTASDAGVVAGTPDPSWPQASGTGTWKRDVTPCGGLLSVSLTLQR